MKVIASAGAISVILVVVAVPAVRGSYSGASLRGWEGVADGVCRASRALAEDFAVLPVSGVLVCHGDHDHDMA